MKTYKHVKTGAIAKGIPASGEPFQVTLQDSGLSSIDEEFLTSGTDWKEVKDPEWTILAFRFSTGRIETFESQEFPVLKTRDEWVDACLEESAPPARIWKVRREKDKVEFTIGDTVRFRYSRELISINRFLPLPFSEGFNFEGQTGAYFALNYAINVEKKPLFKTEDGVDIYETGIACGVSKKAGDESTTDSEDEWRAWELRPNWIYKSFNSHIWKMFSTKEAAEEYIFFNKPVLCAKDLLNGFPLSKQAFREAFHNIYDIVESKLKANA